MSNVYTKDLNEFGRMSAVYGEFFNDKPPVRRWSWPACRAT